MRYVPLTTLLLLLAGLPASAQIGPPQPRAQQHGYSLGVGVHNVQSRWMPYDYDVARNRIYFEGSYGFTDGVEAFGRVGVSDWVINDVESFRPGMTRDVSTDGSPPAFLSGGLRGKAWQFGRVSIGGSLEAAWYSGLERNVRWNYDAYQELFFDSTVEITAALTVGYDLGRSVVYGGPLLHFGYNRVDVRTHEFGPDWDIEDSIDALTIRDKGGWGGFFGWRTSIGENGWHLQLEGAGLRGGFAGALGFFRRW
ncbi:MAG: hypothetical protein A2V98_04545 [Planctomycetes bacterium RBG_16_64_12]|nr:MAG: hypothetical protein A2V98_04545 [Planctomycetes bacterium RBG_16_64_12]